MSEWEGTRRRERCKVNMWREDSAATWQDTMTERPSRMGWVDKMRELEVATKKTRKQTQELSVRKKMTW